MDSANSPPAFFTSEELWKGQLQAWSLIFEFISSFAVKAACQLRIPDILAAHGPLTVQDIASRLGTNSPNTDHLYRLLRLLCAKGVFSHNAVDTSDGVPEPTYGLNPVSAALVFPEQMDYVTAAPAALFLVGAEAQAAWQRLPDCVLHGGVPFDIHYGMDMWSFLKDNPVCNRVFNDAMTHAPPLKMEPVLEHYRGFENLKTLVDVGGGVGRSVSVIVDRYPNIKAVNFDLPHVVATAPTFPGVEQIGGDMFESIPAADAIFLKGVLHNWDDEHCIKILKNCCKALSEGGKVIIMETILETTSGNTGAMFMDLMMLVLHSGKERSRKDWEALLAAAGFPRYAIIELPGNPSYVIEAYPEVSV